MAKKETEKESEKEKADIKRIDLLHKIISYAPPGSKADLLCDVMDFTAIEIKRALKVLGDKE